MTIARALTRGAIVVVVLAATGVLSSAAHAADTTTLTMRVTGCEGCKVTAYNTIDVAYEVPMWKATVTNGVATLSIPTGMTKGMSFDLTTRDYASALGGNAVPTIALGFRGVPAGGSMTKAHTKQKGLKASWCWEGTDQMAATIRVKTYRATLQNPPAGMGSKLIYAWASPTQPVYSDPHWQPAKAMGHQDAPYCN